MAAPLARGRGDRANLSPNNARRHGQGWAGRRTHQNRPEGSQKTVQADTGDCSSYTSPRSDVPGCAMPPSPRNNEITDYEKELVHTIKNAQIRLKRKR